MGTYSEKNWVRPEDDQWAGAVRWRLAVTHSAATLALIEQVLCEAQEAVAESGLSAHELFGDPERYADEVAEDRISEEERAAVDMDGIAPAEHLQGVLLAVGFTGIALSAILMLGRGFIVEVSLWQLVLLAAGNIAWASAVGALLARRAGRIRRSWSLVALAVAALGAGTAAAVPLEGLPPLGELPTLVPVLVYAAILVGAWIMPKPAAPTAGQRELSAEEWFDELGGLLRGRYYLAPAAASKYVTEARAALQESAAILPQDEFGSPQLYALQLVDGSPQPQRAQRRFLAWAATVIAAIWITVTALYLWNGDEPEYLLWRGFATAIFVGGAVLAWRRHLRDRREATGPVDA